MYAIAILRYRKPLEDVLKHVDSHRAYLAGLKQEGLLIASGPLVPRNGGMLLLRVPDNEAQATLDRQARWLQRYAKRSFTIEGHADERGTREFNFALGARRAEAAKAYLVSRGISGAGIHTISYGKERPVAVCNDISCWSQNRRAVTVLAGTQS